MKFIDLLKSIDKEDIRYLLVGGMAVNFHGIIRATKDIDFIVYLERENVLKFCRLMTSLGYLPRAPVKAEDFADEEKRKDWFENKNMLVFCFYHKDDMMNVVDVFVNHPLPFEEIFQRRELIPIQDFKVPVISIPDLITLKKQASRTQDLSDIRALEEILKIRSENASK